jgi:hypothetical protein
MGVAYMIIVYYKYQFYDIKGKEKKGKTPANYTNFQDRTFKIPRKYRH